MGWEVPPAALRDGGEGGVKPPLIPLPSWHIHIQQIFVEHLLESRHCPGQQGSCCKMTSPPELTASRESEQQELRVSLLDALHLLSTQLHPAPLADLMDGISGLLCPLGLLQPMEGARRRLEDRKRTVSVPQPPACWASGLQ